MADDEEERRHFSPDSSTQILHNDKHKHQKKKKHKHKSKKRKRKYSDEQDENSNDENVSNNSGSFGSGDLKEWVDRHGDVLDIKPLTEYIHDRKELTNELFTILGRKELKKLLPRSIKKMAFDELKSRCLDQLEVISKKRLLKIIEGREMSCSSSESEHGEVSQSDIKDTDNTNDVVAQPNPPVVTETVKDESVNILEELSLVPDQHEIDELIEGDNTGTTDEPVKQDTTSTYEVAQDAESQLLELEYRARALKSMVKGHHT